ncbi:MAG: alanine--tRNA ligase [Candidatus Nanoarchaeia archaeon]
MSIKTRKELISEYISFFKLHNHKEIPNSSLIPENDPTVLFTTAGMHPLVPFLLGEKHPLGKRLVNVQKCIRTQDIESVGDTTHLTFFEMLGNWSLGDYFKKEAIEFSFKFLTQVLKIPIERLAVTCFGGDARAPQVPKDQESKDIWLSLGIPEKRIAFLEGGVLESDNNWWGPAGLTGPCGPDTEMFYWKSKTLPPEVFDPSDKNWVEIWNDVLMQYYKNNKGEYESASQKNIDTGMGVERTLTILGGLEDVYLSACFFPIIQKIEGITGKKYIMNNQKPMRIIADHIKASVFIIADGIMPSNTGQGYVLRKLIRRAVRYAKELGIKNFTRLIAEKVFEIYDDYQHIQTSKEKILEELQKEEKRFLETLENGIKEFEKMSINKKELSGKDIFLLYQSYGFPLELTEELAKEKHIKINLEEYEKELKNHQELSRTASLGMFKSGLADNSEATTKLHTATHILNQALRIVLKKPDIFQKGSNITPERLRFDFNFDRKLTEEEIKQIEALVNEKISQAIPVIKEEMTIEQAKNSGAQGVFENKYGEYVSVYSVGDFSKEICAGPHVANSKDLGHFKILKEESVASGIRRIKAILE